MELPILEFQQESDVLATCDKPRLETWRPRHFWTWAHRLTALTFLFLLVAAHLRTVANVRGAPSAVTWFSTAPVVDPLAASEVLLASHTAPAWMLLGGMIAVVLAALLGRVFCGWLCPLGLFLEMSSTSHRWIRRGAQAWGLQIPLRKASTGWKYWLLAFCLVLSLTAGVPIFTSISPINFSIIGAIWWPWYTLAILLILAAIEVVWPRVFCRALCPLGAFYSLLGKKAPLRIKVVGDERLRCRQCVMHCPMGIDVMNDHVLAGQQTIDDPECTRCGVCTDVCHGDILRLRWSSGSAKPNSAD